MIKLEKNRLLGTKGGGRKWDGHSWYNWKLLNSLDQPEIGQSDSLPWISLQNNLEGIFVKGLQYFLCVISQRKHCSISQRPMVSVPFCTSLLTTWHGPKYSRCSETLNTPMVWRVWLGWEVKECCAVVYICLLTDTWQDFWTYPRALWPRDPSVSEIKEN